MSSTFALPPPVAAVAVHLLKGVVYRDRHEAVWQDLLTFQGPEEKDGDEELYEVRRFIKALVDAEWLSNLAEKLAEYKTHADGTA